MIQLKSEEFLKSLDEVMPSDKFILKEVAPVYAYADGKRTDKIEAYRYTLVDPESFDTFDVKIKGATPIVTSEMVADKENRFWVALDNAIVKPFKMEYGKVSCSVVADSIRILSE